jgi:TM2 domain-containing membrane protein YozV
MRCCYHPDREAIGTCTGCGRALCEECRAIVNGRYHCLACASAMASAPACKKEPLFSLVLSFLLPGLGQIYNGQTNRGLIFIICTIASWLLTAACIGIFIFLGIWVYAMYDAYTVAQQINRGEAVCA